MRLWRRDGLSCPVPHAGVVLVMLTVVVSSVGVAGGFDELPLVVAVSQEPRLALLERQAMTSSIAHRSCTKQFGARLLRLDRVTSPEKVRMVLSKVRLEGSNLTQVWLGSRTNSTVGGDLEKTFPASTGSQGVHCTSLHREEGTSRWRLISTACGSPLVHALCRLPPDSPRQTFLTRFSRYEAARGGLRDYASATRLCRALNLTGLARLRTLAQQQLLAHLLFESRIRAETTTYQRLWVANMPSSFGNTTQTGKQCPALQVGSPENPFHMVLQDCNSRLTTLCEHQEGSNVALGKSVYASSVDPISGPSALAATDDQPWTSVKTQATIKPWIIVDLGFQYDITAVTVTFLDICKDSFQLLIPMSRQMKSQCQENQVEEKVSSLEECIELACFHGVRAFNYRFPVCGLSCARPIHNIPAVDGGWDVYYKSGATVNVTVEDQLRITSPNTRHCEVIKIEGSVPGPAPHVTTCPTDARGRYIRLELLANQSRVLHVAEVNVEGSLAPSKYRPEKTAHIPCVFPFTFNESTYSTCAPMPSPLDSAWTWCGVRDHAGNNINLLRPCYHVRLVAGRTGAEGLLEMSTNGTWWRVASRTWTDRHALIVCRQLGYSGGRKTPATQYPLDGAPVIRFDWTCDNTTSMLDACAESDSGDFEEWGEEEPNVGAICDEDEERPRFLGNPAFSRSRVDESGVGGVVMSSPMNHTGLLVSWTAFVSMPGTLSLFLLRPVGGRNDTYTIVDVNVFALTSVGQHTSYLDNTDTRIVYAGDRIGLTFRDTNPIPYDVMPLGCKGTPHFNLYRVSIEIGDGDVMLSPSDVVQPGCRLYSLYASVHSIGLSFSSLWRKRKYTAIGRTLRYTDARTACKVWGGVNTTLLTIGPVDEYKAISQWLFKDGRNNNYWVITNTTTKATNNSGLAGSQGSDGAYPGCHILQRVASPQHFFFGIADCSAAYPVICEGPVLPAPPKDHLFVPPSGGPPQTGQAADWGHNLAMGLGILGSLIIIIFIITFALIRWRNRCNLFQGRQSMRHRRDSEARLQILSPSAMETSCS